MSDTIKRAWLITPHAPTKLALSYDSITSKDLIIAVDGGFERCLELNLKPSVLIGDFDSLRWPLLDKAPTDCQKITYPSQKNETDTQLALQYCLEQGIQEIYICNDLNGRFDHALALVQNLLQAHQSGAKATIVSAHQLVYIIDNKASLNYPVNSIISLISLSEKTEFSASQGLQYPLHDITLFNNQSRGISNMVTEPLQEIQIKSGLALIIVTFQL
ncbi:MAG: thiamine diphosphokinase [Candidatus Cloacimonadaceae bacterium]